MALITAAKKKAGAILKGSGKFQGMKKMFQPKHPKAPPLYNSYAGMRKHVMGKMDRFTKAVGGRKSQELQDRFGRSFDKAVTSGGIRGMVRQAESWVNKHYPGRASGSTQSNRWWETLPEEGYASQRKTSRSPTRRASSRSGGR